MFREIFRKVRTEGKIDLASEVSIRDVCPIVYTGESDSKSATTYYNSGGRSIVFEKGDSVYRVKGVDPHGYLTERVASSRENRIGNVESANELLQSQLSSDRERRDLGFNSGKPFGVFYLEQARKEIDALRRLEIAYHELGIQSPCIPLFYKDTGVQNQGQKTYQTAFRLPSLEADVRTHEFMNLLTERLDNCPSREIAEKSKNIGRLFGRFIYWAGVNTGIFAKFGVLPIQTSFFPQNWVISRYRNGYGIFRVDHTSTKLTDPDSVVQDLLREKDGLYYMLNEFSVYASRVQVASNPDQFLEKKKRKLKFSQILGLTKGMPANESRLIQAHQSVFQMGVASSLQGMIEPIPEEMFREALE